MAKSAIGPTVVGAATVKGVSVLVVAAGENAESLEFVNIPLKEQSVEEYQAAFTQACKDLGFGEDGEKQADVSDDESDEIVGTDPHEGEPGESEQNGEGAQS